MARNPRVGDILIELMGENNTGGGDVDQCLLTTDGWVIIEWLCTDVFWAKKIGVQGSHPNRYKKNWHKFVTLRRVTEALNACMLTLINYDNRNCPSQNYSILEDVEVIGDSQSSFEVNVAQRIPEGRAANFDEMKQYMRNLYSTEDPEMSESSRIEQVRRFSADIGAILYIVVENDKGDWIVHKNPTINGEDVTTSEDKILFDSIRELSDWYLALMGRPPTGSKAMGAAKGSTEDRAASSVNSLLGDRGWIDIHSLFSPRESTENQWVVFEFVLLE